MAITKLKRLRKEQHQVLIAEKEQHGRDVLIAKMALAGWIIEQSTTAFPRSGAHFALRFRNGKFLGYYTSRYQAAFVAERYMERGIMPWAN